VSLASPKAGVAKAYSVSANSQSEKTRPPSRSSRREPFSSGRFVVLLNAPDGHYPTVLMAMARAYLLKFVASGDAR
jgi:hypothetical protein